MPEKTEELRDMFTEITGAKEVTEEQEETTTPYGEEGAGDSELIEVIAEMHASCSVFVPLTYSDLVAVVRGYHSNRSDSEMAEEIIGNSDVDTIRRARYQLHLFRATDPEGSEACYEQARAEASRVNDRFREEFDSLVSTAGRDIDDMIYHDGLSNAITEPEG